MRHQVPEDWPAAFSICEVEISYASAPQMLQSEHPFFNPSFFKVPVRLRQEARAPDLIFFAHM
jgi:hypothetical protein